MHVPFPIIHIYFFLFTVYVCTNSDLKLSNVASWCLWLSNGSHCAAVHTLGGIHFYIICLIVSLFWFHFHYFPFSLLLETTEVYHTRLLLRPPLDTVCTSIIGLFKWWSCYDWSWRYMHGLICFTSRCGRAWFSVVYIYVVCWYVVHVRITHISFHHALDQDQDQRGHIRPSYGPLLHMYTYYN